MKNYLSAFVLLGIGLTAGLTAGSPQALADTASPAPHAAAAKAPTNAAAKSADDENQPRIAGYIRTDYSCELGNKVTIYENANDAQRIGLRWKRQLHELLRVQTTTGAHRFEDKDTGLVWINIPAKGILLDAKKGQQLANNCKNLATSKKSDD